PVSVWSIVEEPESCCVVRLSVLSLPRCSMMWPGCGRCCETRRRVLSPVRTRLADRPGFREPCLGRRDHHCGHVAASGLVGSPPGAAGDDAGSGPEGEGRLGVAYRPG